MTQLTGLGQQIIKDATKVMGQVADQVPNAVMQVTPVDTGHLKRSWKSRSSGLQVKILNNAFYSGYVENGTSRSRAQPMITPMIPRIEAEIERAIVTGTDFNIRGGSYSDPSDQLRRAYRARYGSYGSGAGYRG